MHEVLQKVFQVALLELQILLKAQLDALKAPLHGRRRPREVISIALSLWLKSPQAYYEMQASKCIFLPSGRQLQRYKNAVNQVPGINIQVLEWMYHAAKDAKIPDYGYAGGLVHNEAKIQDDLVISKKGGKINLVGFVDAGEKGNLLRKLKNKQDSQALATDVVQVIFQGYSGFRFPLLHYPVNSVKASGLYILINALISQLDDFGFYIHYVMQDGGQENRTYTKIVSSAEERYKAKNLAAVNQHYIICQDFAHNIKKLQQHIKKWYTYTNNTASGKRHPMEALERSCPVGCKSTTTDPLQAYKSTSRPQHSRKNAKSHG